MTNIAACSECFQDNGLRLDAERIGVADNSACPNCGSVTGNKLTQDLVEALAHRFFVWGTLRRCEYGAAPLVQFNRSQSTSIKTSPWFEQDIRLIERTLGIGFFYYGPRLWMIGEVEPLKDLREPTSRASIIKRILSKYPTTRLHATECFYRIRKDPRKPENPGEYDSSPLEFVGTGRLDSPEFPVLYGSQDLPVCVHECHVSAEDQVYVATFLPTRDLKLLDLSALLREEHVTEFESLDLAVHMLFLAGSTLTISLETWRAPFIQLAMTVLCTLLTSAFYAQAACHSKQITGYRSDEWRRLTSMNEQRSFLTSPYLDALLRNALCTCSALTG